jgi:hypothetical protein
VTHRIVKQFVAFLMSRQFSDVFKDRQSVFMTVLIALMQFRHRMLNALSMLIFNLLPLTEQITQGELVSSRLLRRIFRS